MASRKRNEALLGCSDLELSGDIGPREQIQFENEPASCVFGQLALLAEAAVQLET